MTPSDDSNRYFSSRYQYDNERAGVWQAIVAHLRRYLPPAGSVLELGAGYCAFINAVAARERHAIDVFPSFAQYAAPGVTTHVGSCDELSMFPAAHFDVVFASNLFEHLTHESLDATMREVKRILKPGGRLILLQPNYRYCYREYFDDYTHRLVFSHVSLPDLLVAHGLTIERLVPRYLPFSMKSRSPKWPWLVRLYLGLPVHPFAKQMLVVGRA